MEQVCAEASNELFTVIQRFKSKRKKNMKTKQMVGKNAGIQRRERKRCSCCPHTSESMILTNDTDPGPGTAAVLNTSFTDMHAVD